MADFHLGQHLLFRRHAYTVTCHLAPGALQRPTLPLRDGPPFCSVLKMISMHEISWGGPQALPFVVYPSSDVSRLVSACVTVCKGVHAWCQVVSVTMHRFVCAFNGGFAHCRGKCDLDGDRQCPFCVWSCSALLLSLRRTPIASQFACGVYSNAYFAIQILHLSTQSGCMHVRE